MRTSGTSGAPITETVMVTAAPNLNDPTPASEIKQRQGPGGRTLDYVDARFVMDRLDAAVSPENWQDKYEVLPNGSVRCGIGIRFGQDWIWKWDVGDPSDIEAIKGAHSDAFKRAGVKWGIGRDLYGDHSPAVRRTGSPAPSRPAAAEPPPAAVEPDYIAEAQAIFPDALPLPDDSQCPDHHRAWRSNSRGYYCSGKQPDGGWCERKPSKAWQAAHEMVPA